MVDILKGEREKAKGTEKGKERGAWVSAIMDVSERCGKR
jgi:hypothetical protein